MEKHSPCQNNITFKKSSKRNQNPSRCYYNSIITNLKFQHKKPKYHLSNILIQKQIYYKGGPKSLKLLYSIMNLNTISLRAQGLVCNAQQQHLLQHSSKLHQKNYKIQIVGSNVHQILTSRKANKMWILFFQNHHFNGKDLFFKFYIYNFFL